MAVDLKEFEKRLDKLEQEMWALRAEVVSLRPTDAAVPVAIDPLQQESQAIAQRAQAVFRQMGVPDEPMMSLAELQAAMADALSPNALTEMVRQMRDE